MVFTQLTLWEAGEENNLLVWSSHIEGLQTWQSNRALPQASCLFPAVKAHYLYEITGRVQCSDRSAQLLFTDRA